MEGLFRIVFKKNVDSVFVDVKYIKAKSSLMAEWKVSDMYNISRNLILSSSLFIVVAIIISSISLDFFNLITMNSNIETPFIASIRTFPGKRLDVILASIEATIFFFFITVILFI